MTLKVRVLPTLLHKDVGLVKGVRFDAWRRVGSLMQAIKVYNMREVDELVFLDITATLDGRDPDYLLIDDFADDCFMPLAVGGGVRTVEQVQRLLAVGADKVVVNTAAVSNPAIVSEVAQAFGSQCLIVSIDARRTGEESWEVVVASGTKPTGMPPAELARRVADLGAGEILLTSIDRDGTMEGYDLALIQSVSRVVSIPVIASGGAGTYEDLYRVLTEGEASAAAAASIFHFTEQTPLEAKRYLGERGVAVRL